MNIISGRNAQEILPIALDRLFKLGKQRNSRNGPVLQLDGPTVIEYEMPCERVIFHPERDANPFFHMMEAMWMLAGRNDVEFLVSYLDRMKQYSDDGVVFNGAYGFRWRAHFGFDQLDLIVKHLKADSDCRRQVLSMWDGHDDLTDQTSKDLPCNTHAYFAVNCAGALDLTVCNRSNDLVWGCLGANAVHFSFLQEYMAAKLGRPVGRYYQFTNNLHGYIDKLEPLRDVVMHQGASHYELNIVNPYPLIQDDLAKFESDVASLQTCMLGSAFFTNVVEPMRRAHFEYKADNMNRALIEVEHIQATDWQLACRQWIMRRIGRRATKRDMNDLKTLV